MKPVEVITAWGHENILATSGNTFEITKETQLTKRGDCIIAVAADKSIKDLSDQFKKLLRERAARLSIVIQAGGIEDTVKASGNPNLTFNHPTDMVVRKSNYICDRTLAVNADKAAKNLSRSLVAKLKKPQQKAIITFTLDEDT